MKKSAPSVVWFPWPLVVAVMFIVSGCRAPWPGLAARGTAQPPPASAAVGDPKNSETDVQQVSLEEPAKPQASGQQSDPKSASAAEGAALVAVLDQLREIEDIDPQAKEVLLNHLQAAQPENWPLIVKQFKSALAYRQQLNRTEQAIPQDNAVQVAQRQPAPPAEKQAAPPEQPVPAREGVAELPQSSQEKNAEPTTAPVMDPATPSLDGTDQAQTPHLDFVADAPVAEEPETMLPEPPEKTPAVVDPVPAEHDQPETPTAAARQALPLGSAQQVSYVVPATPAGAWQEHLQTAIAQLERTAPSNPNCTADVQQHLRLRLLRQLAGQSEQALAPTPGASPAMQDYWAQQMFTLTTFLDHQGLPDDKQRAASSLAYLDKARSKLAELAVLQVRNLTFVDSVDGFGMYQGLTEAKFRPGQQVSLYCEVENFRSDSTPEGYRTLLATSYEVVDLHGQRVDGQDFPEVEDICRNLRRDFHMQYGVNLPTRIYPGKYQLRLIITDQLSHKIGQTSIPLEIVED